MKKLCLNKLIFETKEVIFPEFLSIFSLTKFEEHYYIFLSSFENPEYADKDFEISKNLAAVSYTHLDVYKRQSLRRVEKYH